jgi:hypothetical protein
MRQHIYIIAFLISSTSFGSLASAQPAPSAVSGDLIDGGRLTIVGNSFGDKANAAPLFFDTQDKVWINGVESRPYAGLANGEPVPVGPEHPWRRGNSGGVHIWREGGYSRFRGDFLVTKRDAWLDYPAGFPSPETKQVRQVYIRWWWKSSFDPQDRSYSPDGTGTSAKFVRIWDTTGGKQLGIRVSWTQMHMTGMGGSSWAKWNGPGAVGNWNLFEVYLDIDSGSFEAKINNEIVHDVSGYVFEEPYQGIQPRLWGLDGSGHRDWSGETIEFSDYYADDTRARVEIGDAPTWAEVTIREPQVPLSWAEDQISVELYQGHLDRFDGKYLYVIDSAGRVNAVGLPLGISPAEAPSPVSVD